MTYQPFCRVNSKGTTLRGSDLALAQVTAKWPGCLADFQSFEKKCNEQCDNCKNPRERGEGSESVLKLLKAVRELEEQFKARHYCAYLSGMITSEIKSFKHHSLPGFGSGKDRDEHFWNAVIRQVVIGGLLAKDVESFGILKLTEAGKAFSSKQ